MPLDAGESVSAVPLPGTSTEPTPEVAIDLREEGHPRIEVGPLPRVEERKRGLLEAPAWKLAVKRGIDIVGSVLFLALLAPIMVLTALVISVTSRGRPVLPQERIGRNGEPFQMFKFRTMTNGAHEAREEWALLNEGDGPVFKIRRDPRITPIGRILRKLSLDETPQLLNVLIGDMSLVGPRPPLPEEVAQYTPYQRQRLSARPGMTCIWQVSGRSDLDFSTWVEMDLEYIREWTPGLDLVLLLKTIPAVISGRGAY